MRKLKQLFLVFLVVISSNTFGQKSFMKFGKISDEELAMTVYSADSNASAVVLGDYGTSRFRFTQDKVYIDFQRHVRIKIFNKESFDKANIIIRLYKANSGVDEKVTSLKGFVFNIENGEVEKTKLRGENIFKDEYDKNHDLVKISMPNIKVGSIIDLTYSIKSPFIFNLLPWSFQDDIPTLRSEYHVALIEYFKYKNWMEGYVSISKSEDKRREKFSYIQSATIDPGLNGGRESGGLREFEADVEYWSYVAKEVPAFKNEPYITTRSDYTSTLYFELQSVNYPWAPIKYYTNTWADINKTLNKDSDFGLALSSDGHLKKSAEAFVLLAKTEVEKATVAYNHIKSSIAWNGRYTVNTTQNLRKTYTEKVAHHQI